MAEESRRPWAGSGAPGGIGACVPGADAKLSGRFDSRLFAKEGRLLGPSFANHVVLGTLYLAVLKY